MTDAEINALADQLLEQDFSLALIPDSEHKEHRWQLWPLSDKAMLQLDGDYPSFSTPQAVLAWFQKELTCS